MYFAYFFEGIGSFVGIPEQLSAKGALDFVNFLFQEQRDGNAGRVNFSLGWYVGCAVDVDKGEVAALVGKIAESFFVDVLEYVGENCCDVFAVFVMVVYYVVGLLEDLEKFGYF
jgi:hypothetical protein